MIRAISYTLMFCGVSAGAALALTFVHSAQTNATAPQTTLRAPTLAQQPIALDETVAVRFAPDTALEQPIARIAPVLKPALRPDPSVVQTQPVARPKAAPAPRTERGVAQQQPFGVTARQVIGMSTQSSGDFAPIQFGTEPEQTDIARSSSFFAPSDADIPGNLREMWSTGVYR